MTSAPGKKKVLFVCSGNTCRSPMAEAVFNEMARSGSIAGWEASSAGIWAIEGAPASSLAVQIVREAGMDLSRHRSRTLSEKMLRESDLVITMTQAHKNAVLGRYPYLAGKVFTLKEYAGGYPDLDVEDPFGSGRERYAIAYEDIRKAMDAMRHVLQAHTGQAIGLGSDHAGFGMKEQIRSYLEGEGFSIRDFGTFSEDSVDYPDVAYEVSKAVETGEAGRAILVCGTGIGMCMAANRSPAVRAAVCSEPVSARLSRAHNDSNVLCLGARLIGLDMAKAIIEAWLDTDFEGGRHARRVDKLGLK